MGLRAFRDAGKQRDKKTIQSIWCSIKYIKCLLFFGLVHFDRMQRDGERGKLKEMSKKEVEQGGQVTQMHGPNLVCLMPVRLACIDSHFVWFVFLLLRFGSRCRCRAFVVIVLTALLSHEISLSLPYATTFSCSGRCVCMCLSGPWTKNQLWTKYFPTFIQR